MVVSRFGLPKEICSDQGTQFESAVWKDFCNRLDVKKLRTNSYHTQTNGQAERYVKILKERLRRLLREKDKDISTWDNVIDEALFSIRSSISSSTGKSLFEICFGQPMKLTNNFIFFPVESESEREKTIKQTREYAEGLIEHSQEIYAKNFSKKAKEK